MTSKYSSYCKLENLKGNFFKLFKVAINHVKINQ